MRMIERRIGLLFACFLALFSVATARAVYLGTFKSGHLSDLAKGQHDLTQVIPALRGRIIDRNNEVLAASEDASTVFATPYLVKDPVTTARRIGPLLNVDPEQLVPQLADRKKGFVYLARRVNPQKVARIERMKIDGIDSIGEPRRRYPQGLLAGQLLGTVGVDGKGLFGLEFAQESRLHGQDGEQRVVQDALGQPISLVQTKKMQPGTDLQLTIDAVIQSRVESVLAQVAQEQEAKQATAIVIKPETGEILAIASWPGVNPNDLGSLSEQSTTNLPVGWVYDPGSTFKPFTVSAALEDGLVTPDTTVSCGPSIQVADRVIQNADGEPGGTFTIGKVLAQSINACTVMIGQKVGITRFDHYVRKFGFGQRTGLDFPGEESGIVLDPAQYSGPSLANMAIGQGISVTPIQMATAYAAIANSGILRPPHLIKRIGSQNKNEPKGKRVISSKTAAQVREMLKGVVSPDGTGHEADIPGYDIAGKTGTAQKLINGVYSNSAYVASFVGFAPADHPKLLAMVAVDQPLAQYGGIVSAPAFEKIMSFALPYLGIAPH